jgi:hypothetical protein
MTKNSTASSSKGLRMEVDEAPEIDSDDNGHQLAFRVGRQIEAAESVLLDLVSLLQGMSALVERTAGRKLLTTLPLRVRKSNRAAFAIKVETPTQHAFIRCFR